MLRGKNEIVNAAVPIALLYSAIFLFYGTQIPFMPVWLNWRGLSAGEISIVLAAPYFLRLLVTPAIAMAADRSRAHRGYMITLSWISLAFAVMLGLQASFWPILFLALSLTIANATSMPLLDTITMQTVRSRGINYGRMRLWGSLTFVLASFLGGVAITRFGGGVAIWLIAAACLLTAIAAHALPKQETGDTSQARSAPLWHATEIRELLGQREFQLFLIAAGLAQAAHGAFYTFGTLIWQREGYSATWCGVLWATGVSAEILLFYKSRSVVALVGPAHLIACGAAASILRWCAMAFDPPAVILFPLQLLHGATYGATHIGAMHFIHDAVDRNKAGSSQALYATVAAGTAMGCSTLIAGWIYPNAGSLTYLAMAAISGISLAAAVRLVRIWQGGVLTDGPAPPDALAPKLR